MIEELYTASIRSSNLRCETRDGTPIRHIDVVTAFGMSRSSMGLALLRLHTEWDGSEIRAGRELGSVEMLALRSMRTALAGLAHWLAGASVQDAQDKASRAIEHWLNRNCPRCKGAGEVVTNGLLHTCPVCKGVKTRREPHDPMLRKALNFMDDCCASARGSARKRLWGNH